MSANLVLPHFLLSKDYLLLGVALIATTVNPHMQLYAAGGVVDRGVTPEDYRNAKIDTISGALLACVISITVIIGTGAAKVECSSSS